MNQDLFDILKENSLLKKLPKTLSELWNSTMSAPEEAMDTGVVTTTQEIAKVEALESVVVIVEVPKSL